MRTSTLSRSFSKAMTVAASAALVAATLMAPDAAASTASAASTPRAPVPPRAPVAAAASFSDVDADNPFKADIDWLASEGITTGYPDGTFRPTGSVNRDAMAAFLYRLAVGPEAPAACTAAAFSDVGPAHQFCPHIAWLVTTGVTTGWPDGTYRPGIAVSREAMAAFLYRLANDGADAPACTADPFDDVAAADPFCGEITWLAEQGVTSGWPDGTFRPGASIERQAMAAFLHRFADKGLVPQPDALAPDARIDEPASGAIVGGVVDVRTSWSAVDDLAGLDLLVDDTVAASDSTAPFELAWDSTGATPGLHELTVVATDTEGRTGTSAPVPVIVHQGPDPLLALEADLESGAITREEYARYGVYRWFEPARVPEEYRIPAGVGSADLTAPLMAAIGDITSLDPTVGQELLDYFIPVDAPALPLTPMTPAEVDAGLVAFIDAETGEPAPPAEVRPGDTRQLQQATAAADPPGGRTPLRRGVIVCDPETVHLAVLRTGGDVLDHTDLTCVYRTPLADFYFASDADDPVNGIDTTTDRMDTLLEGPTATDRPNGVPDALDAIVEAHYQATTVYRELGFAEIPHQRVAICDFPGGLALPVFGLQYIDKDVHTAPAPGSSAVYLARHELFHQYQYYFTNDNAILTARIGADYSGAVQTSTAWWMEASAEWASHQAELRAWGAPAASVEFTSAELDYAGHLNAHLGDPSGALTTFVSPVFRDVERPQYGAFIFAEYLEDRTDVGVVHEVWSRMSVELTPIEAIVEILAERGLTIQDVVTDYHRANFGIEAGYPDEPDAAAWADRLPTRLPGRSLAHVTAGLTVRGETQLEAGGAFYVDLDPSIIGDGLMATVDITTGAGDLDAGELRVRAVPLASGALGNPVDCSPWGDPARPLEPGGDESQVLLLAGCDRAVLVISHTDPTDHIQPGRNLGVSYAITATPVGVVGLAGPTTPLFGPDAAVAAVGDYSAGYLLNADGTVAQYADERIAPVEGLTGVTQLAIGTGGNNAASRSGYAVTAGGRLERLAGASHAPLEPDVTGVRSIATFWDTAVYAIKNDGTLLYIDDLAITPVAGAADVVEVETWSYGRYGGGLARTADGGVLYLTEATAQPFDGASQSVDIEATWFGEGYAVRADGGVDILRVSPYASPAEPAAHPVPGIGDAVRLVAPESGDMAAVLTATGGLLLVECADQACAEITVLDTGLSGVERAVARYDIGAQAPLWALLETGELYDVYVESDELGTQTLHTVSTGLSDVVSLDQSAGLRYVVQADGRVTWRSSDGTNSQVGSITTAERVFCAYDRCFVGFD